MKKNKLLIYILFGMLIFIRFNNNVYAERITDYECYYKKESGTKDYKDYILVTLNKDGSATTKMGDSKGSLSEKKLPFSLTGTDYNLLRNYIETNDTCYPYMGFIINKDSLFVKVSDTASFMETNTTREVTYYLESFNNIKKLWADTGAENNTSSENSNSSNNNSSNNTANNQTNTSSNTSNTSNTSSSISNKAPSGDIIGKCVYDRTSKGAKTGIIKEQDYGTRIIVNLYSNYGIGFVQFDNKTEIKDYYYSSYKKNEMFINHKCPDIIYIEGNNSKLTFSYNGDTYNSNKYTHIYALQKDSSFFESDTVLKKDLTCPYNNVEVKTGIYKNETIRYYKDENKEECKMDVYVCSDTNPDDGICDLVERTFDCTEDVKNYLSNQMECPDSFKFDPEDIFNIGSNRSAVIGYSLDGNNVNNLPETFLPGGNSGNTTNHDNPGENVEGCEGLIGPNVLALLNKGLNLIMIVGPMLAVVLGSYDLLVAMAKGEEEDKKKGIKRFKNRLIAAALLLLLPAIVELLLNFFNQGGSNCL